MKLVGATDWFIRWPFVHRGRSSLGALGGAARDRCCSRVGKIALVDPLVDDFALIAAPRHDRLRRRSSRVLLSPAIARQRAGLGALAAPLPAGLIAPSRLPEVGASTLAGAASAVARSSARRPPPSPIAPSLARRRLLPAARRAGIWLGGRHPDSLPGPVRDVLAGDEATRVVDEAIDEIEDRYYRKIPRDELADDAIAGVVEQLDDRFSQLLHAEGVQALPARRQNSAFTGVGVTVCRASARPARRARSTTARPPSAPASCAAT